MSATTGSTRIGVAALLRAAYPAHAAKLAARAADVSPRTAEAWVTGRRDPAASVLLRMAARCDLIANQIQQVLDARQGASARHQGSSAAGATPAPGREVVRP